jgi:hypothetical protein
MVGGQFIGKMAIQRFGEILSTKPGIFFKAVEKHAEGLVKALQENTPDPAVASHWALSVQPSHSTSKVIDIVNNHPMAALKEYGDATHAPSGTLQTTLASFGLAQKVSRSTVG